MIFTNENMYYWLIGLQRESVWLWYSIEVILPVIHSPVHQMAPMSKSPPDLATCLTSVFQMSSHSYSYLSLCYLAEICFPELRVRVRVSWVECWVLIPLIILCVLCMPAICQTTCCQHPDVCLANMLSCLWISAPSGFFCLIWLDCMLAANCTPVYWLLYWVNAFNSASHATVSISGSCFLLPHLWQLKRASKSLCQDVNNIWCLRGQGKS